MPFTLLDRLQRRFGRFAVPNLTLILVIAQAALYVASFMPQGISVDRIKLDPAMVMQGEVWRLVTFLVTPPTGPPIFALFYFMLFHLFGSTLERDWGAFKYNVFLLVGWLANVIASFAGSALLAQQLGIGDGNQLLQFASIPASSAFLYGSVFLAFARLYPNFIMNIFWVLPIRVKWLALLAWLGYGYMLIRGGWMVRMLIVATVLNYLLFFGPEHWRELRHGQRRRSFQATAKQATSAAKHTCVVCGLTSDESPRTPFRYCSKCSGQRGYCPDHIRDHEHVIDKEPVA